MVVHLAAEVGGIGANRANPGRYFYANMAMGLHVIEASRMAGVEKVVQVGTVCAYPKHTPVPFSEAALWDGYPEETNAPYGIAKKSLLVMLQGYREQYGLPGIYLLPVNLYGPGDNFSLETSHVIPALIRKFCAADGRGCTRSRPGAPAAPAASSSTSTTPRAGSCSRPSAMTAPSRSTSAPATRSRIRDLAELIARLTGFEGVIRWDPTRPDGQPRRMLDTTRAAERFGFRAEVGLEEGLRRTIDWWVRQDG